MNLSKYGCHMFTPLVLAKKTLLADAVALGKKSTLSPCKSQRFEDPRVFQTLSSQKEI